MTEAAEVKSRSSEILELVDTKRRKDKNRIGHVYVIESSCKKMVKIGRSVRPDQRVNEIKTISGGIGRVFVSGLVIDATAVESALHTALSGSRAVGEWFTLKFEEVIEDVRLVCESHSATEDEKRAEQKVVRDNMEYSADKLEELFGGMRNIKHGLAAAFLAGVEFARSASDEDDTVNLTEEESEMKTIWKYELQPGLNDFSMPARPVPLTVQVQDGVAVLWVMVNPESELKAAYHFNVYGIGHQIPDDPGTYVGTFQYPGELVFHVFMEEGCDPE